MEPTAKRTKRQRTNKPPALRVKIGPHPSNLDRPTSRDFAETKSEELQVSASSTDAHPHKEKPSMELLERNKRAIVDLVRFASITLLDDTPIGVGAFGAVYQAIHNDWGCRIAYKRLNVSLILERNKADQQLIQNLKYEAEIHRQLRHPNIVSMLGVVFEEGNYGIILEYVAYGSWTDFLNNIKNGSKDVCCPWILKIKLSHEISSGMSYLHTLKIIHCDLTRQNILIGEQISAKISDFGLSKWKDYSRSHTNVEVTQGTPTHISPEQWKNITLHPNEKTDVYSFSILLWEMFTEKEAYEEQNTRIMALVIEGRRLTLECMPEGVPKEIHSLIKSCWDQEAAKRPGFSEIATKLRPFLLGPKQEARIKDAVETVLTIYHKNSSNTLMVAHLKDSDHTQKIQRVHETLCEFIRSPDQILSSLFQKRAVTTEELVSIRSAKTLYEWTRSLLGMLCAKPATAYEFFLEALNTTNQRHLYLLLEDKDYKLNIEHKGTLIDNFTYLNDNITLSDSTLLDTLLEMGVLNPREVNEIRAKTTDHERTDQLLQCILRTSQEQYQQFLDALNKSSHQHVYTKLKGADEEYTVPVFQVLATTGEQIRGITVLDRQVFVVRGTAEVIAYNTNNLAVSDNIMISHSHKLHGIISCAHNKCLYLYDNNQKMIHRYEMSDKTTTSWFVRGLCYGLSVTKSHNILVTLHDTKQVKEYTSSGDLIREISLDNTGTPYHCVQLSTGNFVLAYFRVQNSISIVDPSGNIIQSFGGSPESTGSGQFFPRHLAVDKHDNVMVADRDDNRVLLVGPTLNYLRDIKIPDHVLREPCLLYFDELSHRLYIGEFVAGRMFVLYVKDVE